MARQAILQNNAVEKSPAKALNTGASVILGLLALGLMGANLSGTAVPFLAAEREALIALAVVGLAMCAIGPLGRIGARGNWLSWGGVAGASLGVVALAIVAAGLGFLQLPVVTSTHAAFLALAGVMALKLGLGLIWRIAR